MTKTLSKTWYFPEKSLILLEGVTLLGHLKHVCTVYPWDRYLFYTICSAVNEYLRNGMCDIINISTITTMASAIRNSKTDDERIPFDKFVQKTVCKSLYSSKRPYFISK